MTGAGDAFREGTDAAADPEAGAVAEEGVDVRSTADCIDGSTVLTGVPVETGVWVWEAEGGV